MQSKSTLFGHPVHQTLIVFPLGLLAIATVFDVIRLATGSSALAIASYYMIAAGVISGLVAAVLALVSGWLGGELVDRLGVGVHDGANLDAPSSLSRR